MGKSECIICMGIIAASVLIGLFVDGKKICYTTGVPKRKSGTILKCQQHTIHDPRGPEKNIKCYTMMFLFIGYKW